jgi:hypothetical protein
MINTLSTKEASTEVQTEAEQQQNYRLQTLVP